MRRGSIFSEMLMCGGGVHSILLLPPVARCMETIDVCIWHKFVFMSVVVIVWVSVGMFVVQRPLLEMLMLVEAEISDHMEEEVLLQSRSHDFLIGSHECLLMFTPSCCCECFYHLWWLVCFY